MEAIKNGLWWDLISKHKFDFEKYSIGIRYSITDESGQFRISPENWEYIRDPFNIQENESN